MTTKQENNLAYVKLVFDRMVDKKYREGAAEHGGELLDVDAGTLINFALDEAIDQVVYLLTLKRKLDGSRSPSTGEV